MFRQLCNPTHPASIVVPVSAGVPVSPPDEPESPPVVPVSNPPFPVSARPESPAVVATGLNVSKPREHAHGTAVAGIAKAITHPRPNARRPTVPV